MSGTFVENLFKGGKRGKKRARHGGMDLKLGGSGGLTPHGGFKQDLTAQAGSVGGSPFPKIGGRRSRKGRRGSRSSRRRSGSRRRRR